MKSEVSNLRFGISSLANQKSKIANQKFQKGSDEEKAEG
jgi:hypothetical protein